MFAVQRRHSGKVLTVSCRPDYLSKHVFWPTGQRAFSFGIRELRRRGLRSKRGLSFPVFNLGNGPELSSVGQVSNLPRASMAG